MNQILFAEEDNNRNTKTTTQLDIRKIIRVFCIFILLFGIALTGVGSYQLAQNAGKRPPEEIYIEFDIRREDTIIYLTVSHPQGLEKVVYKWNENGTEHVIDGNGKTKIDEQIAMPSGRNNLIVTATDINGKTERQPREYFVNEETGVDITKPEITLVTNPVENGRGSITILAIDDKEIDYITYRWNDEPETKVKERDETKRKIEVTIPVLPEENTLTVVAYDKEKNVGQDKQPYIGLYYPKIEILRDETAFIIKASDELGLKGLIFEFNGKKYNVPINAEDKLKEVEYRQEFVSGLNTITVYVLNVQDVIETNNGQYNYNP